MTYKGLTEPASARHMHHNNTYYAEFIQKLDDIVWSEKCDSVWTLARPLALAQVPWFGPPLNAWRARKWAKAKACEHDVLRARIQRILDRTSDNLDAETMLCFQKLCLHHENIARRYQVVVEACSD